MNDVDPKDNTVWEGFNVGYVSLASGRSEIRAACARCGGRSYFTLWSWAGNGKARCQSCGCWVGYQGGKHGEYSQELNEATARLVAETKPGEYRGLIDESR